MMYFKAPGRFLLRDSPAAAWGSFVIHVEVLDDQRAARQICVFGQGRILRYDRNHWCDDFGMLLGLRFSRKPKWQLFFPGAVSMASTEFEDAWRTALRSPFWQEQLARSRKPAWGNWQ